MKDKDKTHSVNSKQQVALESKVDQIERFVSEDQDRQKKSELGQGAWERVKEGELWNT